jgi:hypothetical protein
MWNKPQIAEHSFCEWEDGNTMPLRNWLLEFSEEDGMLKEEIEDNRQICVE